jgi:hypothetical protein
VEGVAIMVGERQLHARPRLAPNESIASPRPEERIDAAGDLRRLAVLGLTATLAECRISASDGISRSAGPERFGQLIAQRNTVPSR